MTSVREIVVAARAGIENLAPADVATELARDWVLLVDVREPVETAHGGIPGAMHVPRGLLESRADPGAPQHVHGFVPGRRVIVYSSTGARSALAVRSLRELGYRDVAHLGGGLDAWIAEGRPVNGTATSPTHPNHTR